MTTDDSGDFDKAPTDDFGGETPSDLTQLLEDVLHELRKFGSPAFERSLLEEIRKNLAKQVTMTGDLKQLLVDFRHDLGWLRKHIGALQELLARAEKRDA